MAMTAAVKDELSRVAVTKPCCRKSEMAALLRFAGGLHIVAGRVVVEAELDTGNAARRLRQSIAEVYGHGSEVHVLTAGGLRKTSRYIVRVVREGDSLARQTGLLDVRGVLFGGGVAGSLSRARLAHRARAVGRAGDHLPGAGGRAGAGGRRQADRRHREGT
jgi:DNA-binding protein WhiA